MAEHELGFLVDIRRAFSEQTTQDSDVVWVQAYTYDTWYDPHQGDHVVINREFAEEMKRNFDAGVRGVLDELKRPILDVDFDHGRDPVKGKQAGGWVKAMRVEDDAMYWAIAFNEDTKKEIQEGKWRFFSPLWKDAYVRGNDAAKRVFKNVAIAGSLTNRPVMKGMMPINIPARAFSEIAPELEPATIPPVEGEGEQPQGSEIGIEHSEPGTGSPPEEREPDSPIAPAPPVFKPPAESGTPDDRGGEVVDLTALRKQLGLPDDADEATVTAKITELQGVSETLRAASEHADKTRKFAEDYPDMFERMKLLEESDRTSAARSFAEEYRTFTVERDGKQIKMGLAPTVLEKVEAAHRQFSEGTATAETLRGVLDEVARTPGTVIEFGERGGADPDAGDDPDDMHAFSERYQALMKADGDEEGLGVQDALVKAASEFPKGYDEFRRNHKRPVVETGATE